MISNLLENLPPEVGIGLVILGVTLGVAALFELMKTASDKGQRRP